MAETPDIAAIAGLLGDPTRARMLTALLDGRARTATELALDGGVTASTASIHLARMTEAGLVAVARQGRHRYVRLATPEVAAVLESLMSIAPARPDRRLGPRDVDLRRARVCYDHLAGELGVRLLDRLRVRRLVTGDEAALELTRAGETWCAGVGIDLSELRRSRRPLVRPCLDWSERRVHLGGALGAALLARLLTLRYARRADEGRVLRLTPRGEVFVDRLVL
jgi:DNA-binding transcriptional ArsR family regulator